MAGRRYDIVIFGATGFTGEHVARELQRVANDPALTTATSGTTPPTVLRWAIAGRSKPKLDALVARLSSTGAPPTGVVVADVSDPTALRAMATTASVIINATGPYRFFGEPVVAACISEGTSYADLCGEPEFIDRMQLKHAEAAAAAKTLIVHACAFDSIPADIGTLYTALQFPPPSRCEHVHMYHTFSSSGGAGGAAAHATTFAAAVHGFAGSDQMRKQRKELFTKLEAQHTGASKGPERLGPKLVTPRGPVWNKALQKYAFLFPGADAAVVRTTQRTLTPLLQPPAASGTGGAGAAGDAGATDAADAAADAVTATAEQGQAARGSSQHLLPQFGASFCVGSAKYAALTTLMGGLFNMLASRNWGRKLLLRNPKAFTLGLFSEEGPSQAFLDGASFRTVFFGKGWANVAETPPSPTTPFDMEVVCSVSGPEPGYVATGRMVVALARALLEDRELFAFEGGVFTPGALFGSSGGAKGVERLVERLAPLGISFQVERGAL